MIDTKSMGLDPKELLGLTQKTLIENLPKQVHDHWCDVGYMWKVASYGKNTSNKAISWEYSKATGSLANIKKLKQDMCWSTCSKGTYAGLLFVPIDIAYWRWTYNIGFIVLCSFTAIQLISVMFKQNPNRGKNNQNEGTEMRGHRTSV